MNSKDGSRSCRSGYSAATFAQSRFNELFLLGRKYTRKGEKTGISIVAAKG